MKRLLLLCALLGVAAWAADVAGTWKASFEGQNGAREITFVFKTDGGNLTGTVAGLRDKTLEIQNGKVEGDTVSFSVMSEWQGNPVKLVYKGKVSGNEMQINMGTEDGGWSTDLTAKRAS